MIFKNGKKLHIPALVLLITTIVLAALLLTKEFPWLPPRQEYENNAVKKGRIIFSKGYNR